MKLLCEINEAVQVLPGDKTDKPKDYSIAGVFLQSDVVNRNNRVYPQEVMNNEIGRYIKEYVEPRRALGELSHAESPTINMERVSHLVTELHPQKDGNVYGKAKILDTPYGKITKSLIKEGVKLAVSSRAVGSLKKNPKGFFEVQDDFRLSAIDIVHDPSAPEAFVESIMENKEWILDAAGNFRCLEIENYKKQLRNKGVMTSNEQIALKLFKDFLSKL